MFTSLKELSGFGRVYSFVFPGYSAVPPAAYPPQVYYVNARGIRQPGHRASKLQRKEGIRANKNLKSVQSQRHRKKNKNIVTTFSENLNCCRKLNGNRSQKEILIDQQESYRNRTLEKQMIVAGAIREHKTKRKFQFVQQELYEKKGNPQTHSGKMETVLAFF